MSTYLEWFTPEFMEYRQVNEDEARFFFVTNTIIASLVSVYSILMYARLSHETEENLLLNEKMVRDQNHQLLKTNDELDKLVYSISHDLRSPLASVLGLVHLAERSDNNRELKEYCQLIRQRIESLNAFISKTIHLVRNEKLGQVRELINLPFLVAEVFKKLNYTQGAGDIKFETKIDDSFSIETDPLALEIILSNLVSNAIKYRDHQKDNQFVRLSASQVNSTIEIVVEDNGIGIAPDLLKNIFNLFYRADSDKEGSGLGLFIVKDAVNKLDGQITVDSKVGIGTTFKISLRP
ncbi:MAG: HAMP domain-containing histidine kinase [Flammeovirgaceae bacterium]|nr:HAMP domain-containing histidine kinase [Flammeovirgaceae bacterium]